MKKILSARTVCMLLLGVLASVPNPTIAATDQPNIILIIADDLGWSGPRTLTGDPVFSPDGVLESPDHEASFYETPRIAGLANEGIVFRNFYALQTCSPTRASLITGQVAARHRLYHQSGIESWKVPTDSQNPELEADEANFGSPETVTPATESYEDIVLDEQDNNSKILTQSIFRSLRMNGYNVGWFGKNHGTGDAESSDFEAHVALDSAGNPFGEGSEADGTTFEEELFKKLDYLANSNGEFEGGTSDDFNDSYGASYDHDYIRGKILGDDSGSISCDPNSTANSLLDEGDVECILDGQPKHVTDALTDRVVDYIEGQATAQAAEERAFFAWVAFHAPHDTKFGTCEDGTSELKNQVKNYFEAAKAQLPEIGEADSYDAEFADYDLCSLGKYGVIPRLDLFLKHYLKKRSYYENDLNLTQQDLKDKLQDEALKEALYSGMIETLDHSVGRIEDAVDGAAFTNDTLIVFISDNGGADRHTSNQPLAGSKGFLREGGVRVPAIAKWKNADVTGEFNSPAHVVDLFPTFLDLAGDMNGELVSEDVILDGTSLKGVLQNQSPETVQVARTSPVFWHFPGYVKEKVRPVTVFQSHDAGHTHKLYYYYEWDSYQLYNTSSDDEETTADDEEQENLLDSDFTGEHPQSFAMLGMSRSMIDTLIDFGADYPTDNDVNLRPSQMAFTVSSAGSGHFLDDSLDNLPTTNGDLWLVLPAKLDGEYYLQHASTFQRLRVKTYNDTLELIEGIGETYTNYSARWIFGEEAAGGFKLMNKATGDYLHLDESTGKITLAEATPTVWRFEGASEYSTQEIPVTIKGKDGSDDYHYLDDSAGQLSTTSGDAWFRELRTGTNDIYYLRHASTHQRLRVATASGTLELVDGVGQPYTNFTARWVFSETTNGFKLMNKATETYLYLDESTGALGLTDELGATAWEFSDISN